METGELIVATFSTLLYSISLADALIGSPVDDAFASVEFSDDGMVYFKDTFGLGADDVSGGVRYMRGKPVSPTRKTLNDTLNPEAYAYKVANKYNINLRGSGQNVTLEFNPKLASKGLSSSARPTVIQLGPTAFADGATLANTIAHELNHARSWLVGGGAPEEAAYAAGNALQAYIEGLK